MIAPQTLNRLLGQDWTGILRSAADATAFKLMRGTLPNGKDDIWLDPFEGGPPSPRHTSTPLARHAYFIGRHAVWELNKWVRAAAMDGDDRGPEAAGAAPAYSELMELMRENSGITPIDREARIQVALKAYLQKLGDAALTLLKERGPAFIIRLGDVEPFEER